MKKQLAIYLIIYAIPSIIAITISVTTVSTQAQTPITQKSFFFGENPNEELAGRQYTNGEEISYDVSGYPSVVVTIHKWNDIGLAERNLIRTQLLASGYDEQPEVITETGQIIEVLR